MKKLVIQRIVIPHSMKVLGVVSLATGLVEGLNYLSAHLSGVQMPEYVRTLLVIVINATIAAIVKYKQEVQ